VLPGLVLVLQPEVGEAEVADEIGVTGHLLQHALDQRHRLLELLVLDQGLGQDLGGPVIAGVEPQGDGRLLAGGLALALDQGQLGGQRMVAADSGTMLEGRVDILLGEFALAEPEVGDGQVEVGFGPFRIIGGQRCQDVDGFALLPLLQQEPGLEEVGTAMFGILGQDGVHDRFRLIGLLPIEQQFGQG